MQSAEAGYELFFSTFHTCKFVQLVAQFQKVEWHDTARQRVKNRCRRLNGRIDDTRISISVNCRIQYVEGGANEIQFGKQFYSEEQYNGS